MTLKFMAGVGWSVVACAGMACGADYSAIGTIGYPPIHILRPLAAPTGIFPAQMASTYGFAAIANQGAGQTIAIIDGFDNPNVEADLGVFNAQFGLSACTTANGCFQKVFATGVQPFGNTQWGLEMALDVEWAHAIAPQAKILLVEAASGNLADLMQAVDVGVAHGASVVSMSFGGNEFPAETITDSHFNLAHVTFVASSGDSGHGVQIPRRIPVCGGRGRHHFAANERNLHE